MQQWVLLEGFPSIFPDLLPSVDIHVTVLAEAVRQGLEQDIDLVLCDTSGRLHTNYNLMEELRSCKRAVTKALPSAPNVCICCLGTG
jgi:signal recognition particle GTPase